MGLILGGRTCDGDSGGGLVVEKEKSPGRYQLRGILSSGYTGCVNESHSLFASVSYHKNWIQRTLGDLGAYEIFPVSTITLSTQNSRAQKLDPAKTCGITKL